MTDKSDTYTHWIEHSGEESRAAVLGAMAANLLIACGKLVAGALTGSAAMFAEAAHSVAGTVNQIFLFIGINIARTVADESHPHGYGKEPFFWSFLASVSFLAAGATFALYEGIRTVNQDEFHQRSSFDLTVAYAVLAMAFLFKATSLAGAARGLFAGSRRKGSSFLGYVRYSPDLTVKTVFLTDAAALIGLLLAAGGLTLSEAASNEAWDGIASLCIGAVMTAVAILLGFLARNLLLGGAANPGVRDALRHAVNSFPEVTHVVRLLSMHLGSRSILITGELEVDRGLSGDQIDDLLIRIDKKVMATVPEVTETFWELRRRP